MTESESGEWGYRGKWYGVIFKGNEEMTESEKAKAWREACSMTIAELSELTGYSKSAISLFERGKNTEGEPSDQKAFHRYKLVCMGVRFLTHYGTTLDQWEWT